MPVALTGVTSVLSLLWVLGLLGINAFFVAVEFSLVSVRRSRMAQLASEGDQTAPLVQKAQAQLERSLATTQLGITTASLLLGWIGATQVGPLVSQSLQQLPFVQTLETELIGGLGGVITFVLLTYLQIVLGELLPKMLAVVYPEPLSLRLARLNTWVSRLLWIFVEVPRLSAQWILKRLGVPIPDPNSLYSTMTSEELQLLIESSVESGEIEAEERDLLTNVFEFGEIVASEVMITRTNIAGVEETATVQAVLAAVAETGHSRYPVFGGSLDNIRGLVHIKELVAGLARGQLQLDSGIADYIRPALFEHENKLISELLPLMQKQHQAMVVVVDEFGGTAGVLTIKDMVEEIVGTLADDTDIGDESPDIEVIDDHTMIIQAQMDVEAVSEELAFELPIHDDYQTLGGFLIYQLQRIPKEGEKLVFQNWEFIVDRVEGPRLDRIKITRLTSPPDSAMMADSAHEILSDPSPFSVK